MKECKDKIKSTCGSTTYATCVQYETELPTFSAIIGCPTIEETTEELYLEVGKIKDNNDLTSLGEKCLTYVKEDGKNIVKNVLLEYETQICILKEELEDFKTKGICELSIVGCNLNLTDLVDVCGETPTTLGQLLQILINK